MSIPPHAQALAKVTLDPELPRGPDLRLELVLAPAWAGQRGRLRFELPASLACAKCQGGGCDSCARRGALRLRSAEDAAPWVECEFPGTELGKTTLLRLPGLGAPGEAGELPGQLWVYLSFGQQAQPGLVFTPASSPSLALKLNFEPWWMFYALVLLVLGYLVLTRS